MPPKPTIRSLAESLGVSVATVSEALRFSPKVKPETAERIRAAAEEAGYKRNPLLGEAFSSLRRGRYRDFSGTLALVDLADDHGNCELMLFHKEVMKGAEARAAELGFRLELFWVGKKEPALSVSRLCSVLYARGILGVVFLPFDRLQDFSKFEFNKFAAVAMDRRLVRPSLHAVQPEHYLSMRRAVQILFDRGYKRVGLCLETRKDERVDYKWSSGYASAYRLNGKKSNVPPLIQKESDRSEFIAWVKKYKPDVVIGHAQAMMDWLDQAGLPVPEKVGFFRINVTESSRPCAGLDLLPQPLGAAAVEAVVGMLHRREFGIPETPQAIQIDLAVVEGPTIRLPKD
ncbi:LacI family DNA-binding transcriptional regulator [Pelagicoccus sp. NFK12]|uniref:LacI family DNA-binding transcriptional regulator n=1 Tax=Pelagicoccus enzymogenes TaxID=2773457 RepID=A0A927FES2_9BACT|nr:LacI family DNA-binding transcriptional regulator [Pelagicoccus enzymogenes]MBD5782451.1 LacI family DNA-binding transcriptional regulator [Pelagicoccus enzymogenes]